MDGDWPERIRGGHDDSNSLMTLAISYAGTRAVGFTELVGLLP